MDHIEEFVDERQKSWCIHCCSWVDDVVANRDHVPSKSFLQTPYPENLPVVKICKDCNASFSLDEEYFVSLLSSILAGSTAPDSQRVPAAERILRKNNKLRSRIERSKKERISVDGVTTCVFEVELKRIENVIIKNARGHIFYEYGEPTFNDPDYIELFPLGSLTQEQRESFETIEMPCVWPELGSRMMTRIMAGQDFVDGWVVVQGDVYRYSVAQQDGFLVRIVLYEYLGAEIFWSH